MDMESYSVTDLRRKSAEVVDALRAGETVALTHNGTVLAHIVPVARQGVPPVAQEAALPGATEVADLLREQTALLRELVEQGRRPGSATPRKGAAGIEPLVTPRAASATVTIPEKSEDLMEPQEAAAPRVEPHPVVVQEKVEESGQEPERRTAPVETSGVTEPVPAKSQPVSDHAQEVRERDRTGVLWRDGRWELTIAAKEYPKLLRQALIEEAPEEERDLLAGMALDDPELLELIRLRGAALRDAS
jgi:antitoxin (DNA-binding transcriptional repressor) of toxin-antitoxin stability system